MAKTSLTPENVKYLRYAFSHFFPEDAIYSADKPFVSGEFNWNSRKSFIDFVYRLTGVFIKSEKDLASIKKAQQQIETLAEVKEQKAEANIPQEETRAIQEAERVKREASQKEAAANAKRDVEAAIKRQQEIQKQVEGRKLYAKVKAEKAAVADENSARFIEQAMTHPAGFEKDLATSIDSKLSTAIPDAESRKLIAEKTAYDTICAVNHPEDLAEAAILNGLSKNREIPEVLQQASSEIAFYKSNQISRGILASVNKNLADSVYGTSFEVSFSNSPEGGYTHEVDLGTLNRGYGDLLNSQGRVFDNFGSMAGGEIQKVLLGQARTFLDSKIAALPADNAIAGLYNSAIGQRVLSFVGLETGAPLSEGFLGGIIQQIPGAPSFLQGLGSSIGIDFGFGAAGEGAAIVATEGAVAVEGVVAAGGAAIETGISVAGGIAGAVGTGATVGAEVAAVGAVETAATAAAPATGGISLVIGAVVAVATKAVSWVASKIPWQKIKSNLIAISGGAMAAGLLIMPSNAILGGFLVVSGGAGLISGVATGGLSGFSGSISGIGNGIGSFFGALGGAFLGAIGVPIAITLLAFPVIVALMLFVINSGAYVVPYFSERSFPAGVEGGLMSNCVESDKTGADITDLLASQIKGGNVKLYPLSSWGRRDGFCITPLKIIIHWSAGPNDDPDGNQKTYNYLSHIGLSCQLATDTNDVLLTEKFFEKQVEFAACANSWNSDGISNEMAGAFFTKSPPPPNLAELELAYGATCRIMKQYNIPWSQIYGHYNVPDSGGKTDPGKDFLEKVFIPEIRKRCPNGK